MSPEGHIEEVEIREEVKPEDIIQEFLRHNRFLHEYRLQKLIYLLELLSIEENGERVTNLEFKPYMYGSYSEELSNTLEKMIREDEVEIQPDMHRGKVTKAIMQKEDSDNDIPQDIRERISKVQNSIEKISNDELANWSKNSWLYKNTDYDDEMEFIDYSHLISSDKSQSDIRRRFPELVE